MRFIFIALVFLVAVPVNSQDCNPETIRQKSGAWKERSGGVSGIPASDLAKEKKTVAAIHTMIKAKYSPKGVTAEFNGAYNSAQSNEPVNSYYYGIIPLNFYCDGNTIKTAHETSTFFSISANRFDAEIYESPNIKELTSGMGFHSINDMPFEKDGYWHFKTIDAPLGFGMTGKSSSWLITYNGQLPFSYVTRKEFLETRKIILTNEKLQSESSSRDVLKRLEIEKSFKEKEFKNDPEKMNKYLKMDYNDSKARYEKIMNDNEKNYQPAFDKIDKQLKGSTAELNQPAIVKQDPKDYMSYLFTDDNDPFGKVLIKPNPSYFNKKLPRSVPQFFWIYERGNHKEPIAASFMSDIMKAVDFLTLKNMLGK